MKRLAIKLLLLLVSFHFISCQEEETPPNIVWISHEDFSPAWGCYGDSLATTPAIDALAATGYIFDHAFSNAPICAPARSTLISGMYATSLGTQNLRSVIPIPEVLELLPQLLTQQGYFTSNNSKTDYNFSADGLWDDLGNKAHWRNRTDDRPFFAVFNSMITHEGHTNHYDSTDTETVSPKHNPDKMLVPPYFPNTSEFRKIMAHQYDLMTVFDQTVANVIRELKEDGLYDNTIIFIFSDHGHGLPRYKRWLYNTGLQIPFVLHVPDKYKSLVSNLEPGHTDMQVNFVDFAPTVLQLAGAPIPEIMEGHNFLGKKAEPQSYSFGYRDRADDAYDMSRSVFDGRYLYIRNYLPFLPYIQDLQIFNESKWSYQELLRVKAAGELSEESLKMFRPKPVEELYDLQKDPQELTNIVSHPDLQDKVTELKAQLKKHLLDTHDTGLMNEGQMMSAAEGSSVYEMAHDPAKFDVQAAYLAAEKVGKASSLEEILVELKDPDPNVRWWGLNALQSYEGDLKNAESTLLEMLSDASLPNRFISGEILVNKLGVKKEPLAMFREHMASVSNEPVILQLAISIRNLGIDAKPLLPDMESVLRPKIKGDIQGKYKSWMYPMFIGFAMDQTLENCEIQQYSK